MRESWDIVVVGAGPAGSVAAERAAGSGLEVLLIEDHREIGVPMICGEGVSTQGLTRFLDPNPKWVSSEVEGAIFVSPGGRSFKVHHPGAGFILERKIFDRDLAHLASESGAEVRVGARAVGLVSDGDRVRGVKILYRGEKIEVKAKLVIGADGASSSIRRWAGLDTRPSRFSVHVCAQYLLSGIEVDIGYPEFFVGDTVAPGGYGWVFPKDEGLANVGIGVFPPKAKKSPREYLDEFVERRCPEASILESTAGSVPTTPLKKISAQGILLAGDAAGVADPISGAGIANSLTTGEIAGRVAASAIRDGNLSPALKEYEDEVRKTLSKELEYRARVREIWLKLNDRDLETIFNFGNSAFGGKTITETRPREILVSLIKSSPRFLKLARHLL